METLKTFWTVAACVYVTLLLQVTNGILVPQACSTYSMKNIYSDNHIVDARCNSERSAEMHFTVMSSDTHLVIDFPSPVDIREAYLLCNATDNRRIKLLYNGQISQTIDLCPNFYPGYYYPQFFSLYGDDVNSLNITIEFGRVMDENTCINDHNAQHLSNDPRTSAQYPQGGHYPIQCSMRLWKRIIFVQDFNLALYHNGARCTYWRPEWGLGKESYCRRLLDGYIDPWDAPFAFEHNDPTKLIGSWIKVMFPTEKTIGAIGFIQHDYPKIRQFSVIDDAGNVNKINCSLPLSRNEYMSYEIYSVGSFRTVNITVIIEAVEFLPGDTMTIGFYELEMYAFMPASTTTTTTVPASTTTTTTTTTSSPQSTSTTPTIYSPSSTTTTTSTSTTTKPVLNTSSKPSTDDRDRRQIIMIIVIILCIVGLIIIAILVTYLCYRKRKMAATATDAKTAPTTKQHKNGISNGGFTSAAYSNGSVTSTYSNGAASTGPVYDTINEQVPGLAEKQDTGIGELGASENDDGYQELKSDAGYEKLRVESRPNSQITQYETVE